MSPGAKLAWRDRFVAALVGVAHDLDVPASTLTTWRVGGPIAVLVRPHDADELARVSAAFAESGAPDALVVGNGSNLLVADTGFAGVGIVLGGGFEGLGEFAADDGTLEWRVGGAVALPVLARRSAALGRTGLEFYVGIPGTVGGAIRMNAGGHGRDTAAVCTGARVVRLGEPPCERSLAQLAFGYRSSAIGPRDVVVDAGFRVTADDRGACAQRIDEIVRWRREHQPGGANAGSVFANPDGDSAGRLIDAAGLMGLRHGGAHVSQKHANFIQAEAGATAADVAALIDDVRRRVEQHAGVRLRPEVRRIGFSDQPGDET